MAPCAAHSVVTSETVQAAATAAQPTISRTGAVASTVSLELRPFAPNLAQFPAFHENLHLLVKAVISTSRLKVGSETGGGVVTLVYPGKLTAVFDILHLLDVGDSEKGYGVEVRHVQLQLAAVAPGDVGLRCWRLCNRRTLLCMSF